MYYQSYTNYSFNYSVDYPTELFKKEITLEAKFKNPVHPNLSIKLPQEIGIRFRSEDAYLVVWAEPVDAPEKINMQDFFEYHTQGYKINFQDINENYYKASGHTSDEFFFYRHTQLLNTVLYTLWISYDLSQKDTYEKVIEVISDSFTLPIPTFDCADDTQGVEETICEYGDLSHNYARQAKLYNYIQNSQTVPENIKAQITERRKMVDGVYYCPGTTGVKGYMCMVNQLNNVVSPFNLVKHVDLDIQDQLSFYKSLDRQACENAISEKVISFLEHDGYFEHSNSIQWGKSYCEFLSQ